ncbi:hypothetical protein H7H78_18685 [Mycobacterium shinjukuense]|uniref:Uncharacterized protein n=1 Tax=Mycobacterium shinjukuense TaxID=398694 RepID=A0A7I7MRJ6_9MYCO|nr:hypothetical protein [Mycobacterium shinjukuense]MCV6987359.1 hypothetical protein [Mycobacterium shinjukuense]ORB71984.1 hypothetical protein BST45_00920 [Mycobacterium shinjukuense]BBX74736.1 hypothetical protein MSHI_26420 [Mycobacterium shinjukuense]
MPQALADYHGDDVWPDVVVHLDGYDAVATAILQRVCLPDVFVAGDTAYQWWPELNAWQAFDAAAELGEAMTDPLTRVMASALGSPRNRGRRSRRGGRDVVLDRGHTANPRC